MPGSYVSGDGVTREEIDGDCTRGPVESVDAAADGVEARAVALRISRALAAAVVAIARVAVGVVEGAAGSGPIVGHGAAAGCVESDGVGSLAIDTFDDVDFAAAGPVRSECPEGGPDAAGAAGHVLDVGDEEALGVGLVAVHAGGGTTAAWVHGCVVDAEINCAICIASEGCGVGDLRVGIADEAMCGVTLVEEAEGVEEIAYVECVLNVVLGACDASNAS